MTNSVEIVRFYVLILDHFREVHENLQEAHGSLASNSSKEIRSLRTQLERNAAVHVSEIKSLRSELHDTASVVHDLRQKLENARRAKSLAEEQRDKCMHDLDELKTQSSSTKADLERRLGREMERVKVLEDLVEKMEAELERSNAKSANRMSIVSSRMSLRSLREESEDEDEDEGKHNEPGSPVQTLFAEMASMEQDESDEEEQEEVGQFSSPQSPQSSVSLPSIALSQVLQTLREQPEVEMVDCGVQTDRLHLVPTIRVLSPTPPLTCAPLLSEEIEMADSWTQTDTETTSTAVQTDPPQIRSPIISKPHLTSPILRPHNSIRRGSHSVRWQDDKSIQTDVEERRFTEIAIQTDPIVIAKILKPALKTPTSEHKEEEKIRLGEVKAHDGPAKREAGAIAKPGSTARIISTRRLESHRSSVVFGNGMIPATHIHGYSSHERKLSGSSSIHTNNRPSNDLRRGRPSHPKGRSQPPPPRTGAQDVRLHSPTSIHPPLPIPQRSSSKFRVVLPIVRDRDRLGHEESLPDVAEELDPISEEERNRRELNAFLARPPRKTVRQIRSAVNLRSAASTETIPSTPSTHYLHHDPSSFTPSSPAVEMAPKSYSTPRKLPKRLVKMKPLVPEPTPASSVSPASSYFPTNEEVHVVNEIAKCMVGEYMYKYVRKRRRGSFTWKRNPARQQNGYMDEVEESTVRHKRWVYLQPYEKYPLYSQRSFNVEGRFYGPPLNLHRRIISSIAHK